MQRERNRDMTSVVPRSSEEIPPDQLAGAARQLTSLCVRAGGSRLDLVEILEMVGCISPEIAATARAATSGDITPLRLSEALSAPESAATKVVWGWCRKGKHRMVGANVWHSPTMDKRRCRACGKAQRASRTK